MSRMTLCNMLGVTLLFSLCPLLLQAQTLKITSTPTSPIYVKLGQNLTLDVTYDYVGTEVVQVKWSRGSTTVIRKSATGKIFRFDNRVSLNGASFVLTNTEQNDNTTFKLELSADDVFTNSPLPREFIVIVEETPTAVTKCSTLILKEGEDFECLCYSNGGNPPPTASWYNGSKVISGPEHLKTTLSLKKITRYEAGNYTCIVKSHDLKNESQIKVQVQYGPTKATLKPVGGKIVGERFILTCSASAFPLPDFTIIRNGMELKDNVKNGVLTIASVTLKDGGHYKCIAKNRFGNATASFTLTVKEKQTTPTISTTTTNSNTMSAGSNLTENSNCGTKWYIIAIAVICGICFGMVFLYAIQSLCQRIKNKKDNSEPAPYEIPENQQKETEDNSAYQELELQNREPENSYQALRKTRRKVDNEIKIEDEAGYQELDKVRENNDNYQSLNRV